ncbi:hypothetical protein [Aeromicrobium sp. CTD01-1L150]|uniref:hypothetical protein n=1 Tax=Aeromicrobium sp. CTD01-1L150 TaxID=3341830 RepID=UPI0035C037E8
MLSDASAWRLQELSSRCPAPEFAADQRSDPYYDGLFPAGGAAAWVDVFSAMRQVEAGLATMPAGLDQDHDAAVASLRSRRGFDERLRVISVLDSWRTVTAAQLAAFTGFTSAANVRSSLISTLFAAGVADIGQFTNVLHHLDAFGGHAAMRPSRSRIVERHLLPQLTWPETVAMTGGTPVLTGGTYDRHNILTAELGLRLGEYVDEVAFCLGEKFSHHDMLLGSAAGGRDLSGTPNRADMTAVRSDGLRVVVETSTTPGRSFEVKARTWARLLSEVDPADAGVFVLFVTAERAETRSEATARNEFLTLLNAAVREHPGPSSRRTAERMGLVSWREWFPSRLTVSEAFLAGSVHRPTGPADAPWESVDLWGGDDVRQRWRDPTFGSAVLDNAHLLWGVPTWQRDTRLAPPLWADLIIGAGWSELPVPESSRAGRVRTRPFGAGSGAAQAPQPPRRLTAC